MNIPIAYALRKAFKSGYGIKTLKADLTSGLIVSLISLPLAMALAIAVGLPPYYGIYTAIVAGFVAAAFGGSNFQVTGPTGAFVVVLAPIIAEYGTQGLMLAQAMAGLIIVLMAIFRMGFIVKYISHTVTVGFTSAIALVLCILSLKDLAGLQIPKFSGYLHKKLYLIYDHINTFTPGDLIIGISAIILIKLLEKSKSKIFKYIPSVIVALFLVTALSKVLIANQIEVHTIESVFSYVEDGIVKKGLPDELPDFSFFGHNGIPMPSMNDVMKLLPSAIIIALLAALESLLSATMADNIAKTRHDPNSEVMGNGLANLFSAFISGMPATGALARTAANIRNGAKTPVSAMFSSVMIAIYVMVLSDYISDVPNASLSALLLIVAIKMSHYKEFIQVLKSKVNHEKVTILSTFIFTAAFDMVIGVTIGVIVSFFMFIRQVNIDTIDDGFEIIRNKDDHEIMLRFKGPLFFGNAEKMIHRENVNLKNLKAVTIDLTESINIDISFFTELENLFIANTNIKFYVQIKKDITHDVKLYLGLQNVDIIKV